MIVFSNSLCVKITIKNSKKSFFPGSNLRVNIFYREDIHDLNHTGSNLRVNIFYREDIHDLSVGKK